MPAQISIIFEIVTKGGHAIPSEPEEWESIHHATEQAGKWMKMKGQSLEFITIDGGGAVVSIDDIEHITTTPKEKWLARQGDEYLVAIGMDLNEKAEANE
jgi:hypothetical protein